MEDWGKSGDSMGVNDRDSSLSQYQSKIVLLIFNPIYLKKILV